MRAIVILIVAAILGFFGYQYLANGKTLGVAFETLTGAATEMVGDAATVATDVVSEVTEGATDMADDAAAATAAAQVKATAVAESAALLEAANVEAGLAANGAIVLKDAVAEASGEVSKITNDRNSNLLTLGGFDAEKVLEMISTFDLSDEQKTVLSNSVDAVKDDPSQLEATLDRLKDVLGR